MTAGDILNGWQAIHKALQEAGFHVSVHTLRKRASTERTPIWRDMTCWRAFRGRLLEWAEREYGEKHPTNGNLPKT